MLGKMLLGGSRIIRRAPFRHTVSMHSSSSTSNASATKVLGTVNVAELVALCVDLADEAGRIIRTVTAGDDIGVRSAHFSLFNKYR